MWSVVKYKYIFIFFFIISCSNQINKLNAKNQTFEKAPTERFEENIKSFIAIQKSKETLQDNNVKYSIDHTKDEVFSDLNKDFAILSNKSGKSYIDNLIETISYAQAKIHQLYKTNFYFSKKKFYSNYTEFLVKNKKIVNKFRMKIIDPKEIGDKLKATLISSLALTFLSTGSGCIVGGFALGNWLGWSGKSAAILFAGCSLTLTASLSLGFGIGICVAALIGSLYLGGKKIYSNKKARKYQVYLGYLYNNLFDYLLHQKQKKEKEDNKKQDKKDKEEKENKKQNEIEKEGYSFKTKITPSVKIIPYQKTRIV